MATAKETLPFLAALLEIAIPLQRQYAVQGLSFFANGVGTQTSSFRTKETERYFGFNREKEQEYISFWRNWWNLHRAELSSSHE